VTLTDRLHGMTPADQAVAVLEVVRGAAAAVLGHASVAEIVPTRRFKDLGFDSLTGVELRNRLNETTGLRLPPALTFNYPTPAVLAAYVHTSLGLRSAPGSALSGPDAPAQADSDEFGSDEFDFDAASDSDIFELLDRELGRS
jgi:acyl carrier protein